MSHLAGMGFTFVTLFQVLIGGFAIIPAFNAYGLYLRTRLKEFLLLFIFFTLVVFNQIFNTWRHLVNPSKVLIILNQVPFITLYFMFFFICFILEHETISRRLSVVFGLWYLLLIIPYLLGSIQVIPADITMYGIPIRVQPNISNTNGLVFVLGDIYLMAEGAAIPENASFVVLLLISFYYVIKADIPKDASWARSYWLAAVIAFIIRPISKVMGGLFDIQLPDAIEILTVVLGFLILSLLCFQNSNYLLITRSQITRAIDLYEKIPENETKFSKETLRRYIDNLPGEVVQQIRQKKPTAHSVKDLE